MSSPALVAVAHGSRDPAATRSVEALLAEVRRQRPGVEVRGCYLEHAEPGIGPALAALGRPAVAVPLLLTAAFHASVDLPSRLAAAALPAVAAPALGPHPALLRALERRLTEAGIPTGDPAVGVVLAAAGSGRPEAVESVARLAQEWATAGWWDVVPAYASAAAPTPADAVATLAARGAPRVAVASFLLSPGRFADALRRSGADVVSAPLGAAPEVAAVVLERYDDAATRRR